MAKKKAEKKGIYISPRMSDVMGLCGDDTGITPSSRVNDIADRYGEIIRRASLPDFIEDEWNLLRDSLNGVLHNPASSIRGVWQGVEDSITLDGLSEKWAVDGESLLNKLRDLNYTQEVALIEQVEQWWRSQ
jgi:hypothetical protein